MASGAGGTQSRRAPVQVVASALGRVLDIEPALGVAARSTRGLGRELELSLLPDVVKPGDVVVDAGAHRGMYTWHLARLVGPEGQVFAFEPQPDLARYLRRAFRRRRYVKVDPRALSDRAGDAILSIPLSGAGLNKGEATLEIATGHHSVPVVRCTLDSLQLAPSFIKLDIEGHEIALIRGGMQTISRSRPALLVEIDRRHIGRSESHSDLSTLLRQLEYEPHYLASNGDVRSIDFTSVLSPYAVIDPGRYVYNFLFVPRERPLASIRS